MEMIMSTFERLFDPRGIAVIGASADASRAGGQTVYALARHGYRGAVFPVNPRYQEIAGYRCYARIDQITAPCDVAVIALPAAQIPATIAQCGERRIPYAVVLGGGFREVGAEGAARERAMLATARQYEVRLIGPNCLGLVNVHKRVFAAFGSLTREPELQPGAVSAVIQSGGFGNSLVIRCGLAGVGFKHVVASGNEADITAPELINAYVDDPDTRVILAYLEGISDGRAFMAAAKRALAAGKAVIAWKAGNSTQGARAAASHTANLTGSYDIFRAAFRQCGVIEVHDVDEAADFALCLLAGRIPRGRNAAVMGGSGGSAVVFSDTADEVGITLAPPAESTMQVLRENLPSIASLENPIDYAAGFPRADDGPKFKRALDAVLADPNIHQLGMLYATVIGATLKLATDVLVEAAAHSDKPVIAFSVMPSEMAGEGRVSLDRAAIPVLPSPARVARAMGMLADYAEARTRQDRPAEIAVLPEPPALDLPVGAQCLDEHASKRVVAVFGIPVTRDVLIAPERIGNGVEGLRFPVAVKIVSPDIAHKTDIGGVRLGIADSDALAAAAAEVLANVRKARPAAHISGVLACEMVTGGIETIVGVVNDPAFGPVVAFGMGGVFAETIRDVTFRIAPFDIDSARAMVAELRSHALFSGVRGQPARDIDALAQTLARVSTMAWALRERVAEIDINPLLLMPRGQGVIAADALVVLR
jgi:acyl-CoA synthetase (NDP forming)